METWRLIEDGALDGRLSMATDRAILTACGEGKAPPTLRLYGWVKPTLTVGYAQKSDRDVDLTRCHSQGIPVVQRPTGGRALLHEKELTYSLAAPIPNPQFPTNLRDAFCVVSKALLLSLNELGIHEAKLTQPEKASSSGRSPSCFSTLNHHEITVNNKKLIGSAQRRTSRSFLQQGSVWIDCDRELMNSLFQFDTLKGRKNNLEILRHSTISLNQRCNREVEFQEVARAFRAGFQKTFPVQWRAEKLSPYEVELRDRILAQSVDAGGTVDCFNLGFEKNADQK
jgi:lipoate-protein ligase A